MMFYMPIVLMAGATTFYHVAQKSIPLQLNPMVSLLVNYGTALVLSVLMLPLFPESRSLKNVNWACVAVGVSIVGIELAVLLAYRAGWRISLVALVGNVITALLLVGIGIVSFDEKLSGRVWAGIVLCVAGLVLIAEH